MKLKQLYFGVLMLIPCWVYGQKIVPTCDMNTGAIKSITIENDPFQMNWIINADNSQYPWIGPKYQWGLGTLQVKDGSENCLLQWSKAEKVKGNKSIYKLGSKIELTVTRHHDGNDLIEEYEFKNISGKSLGLSQIEINTPFNDNYPDAATCITNRTNAHIWTGGDAAYVNAVRMGATAPHLGLMSIKGAITGYSIKERANEKGLSNTRGVICLNPQDRNLRNEESYKIAWRLFSHQGNDDFYTLLKKKGGIVASSSRYTYQIGENAIINFNSEKMINGAEIFVDGKKIASYAKSNDITIKVPVDKTGVIHIECRYDGDKRTSIDCWGISNIDSLINMRAAFIINKQQYNDCSDPRYGAYLPYDNETNEIYLNFKANNKRTDMNEGAERVGMGIFLAMLYQRHEVPQIKESLLKYAHFLRYQLQKEDYETWSMIEKRGRHRAYNYPWIASFYFEMFKVTGERHYLHDGYQTLRALYRKFKHSFYAIDTPVEKSITLLRANGLQAEADTLLNDFRKVADTFMKNGTNYPKSEVNYEQSIVAPSIIFLEEMYLVTQEMQYLKAVEAFIPVLEAFGGQQPSFHLNGIAIRHWDGYWFGKYRFWGDTMPHYWSTLSADAFANYARCTGNQSYLKKAENILLNNLCLFGEDGSASCAYIYPNYVNGRKAGFFDPFANDQDFALAYLLKWLK